MEYFDKADSKIQRVMIQKSATDSRIDSLSKICKVQRAWPDRVADFSG